MAVFARSSRPEEGRAFLPRRLSAGWHPVIPSVTQLLHGGPCCSTLQRILRVLQDKQALLARFTPSRVPLSAIFLESGCRGCSRALGAGDG